MPKAVGLAEELLNAYKNDISKLELHPGTGGVFEVTLNGQNIFSREEKGRFPNEGEVLETVKSNNK